MYSLLFEWFMSARVYKFVGNKCSSNYSNCDTIVFEDDIC
jgi:hypothetical protein